MKVLLTSQEVPPHTAWGGIGTYVGTIAPALVRAGAEVHVLSVVRGQARSTEVVDGVHVHRAPLVRPPGIGRLTRLPLTTDRLTLAAVVAREYRRLGERFNVVESPEWKAEALFLTRKAPVVVRLHSSAAQVFPHLGPLRTDHRLAVRCENALVRRAHLVIGTRSQLADAGRRLGPLHTREIPLPVAAAAPAPPPGGPPRVLFTGRFEVRKNPETLVRAAAAVLAELPDARFTFVGRDCSSPGRPSNAAWLRELASSLGVAHAVEIEDGWRPRDAVLEAVRSAHVCAVPSLWESFGYAAVEAASVGRPVVASRIPALADVVEHDVTGLLVPPTEPNEWARALLRLLRDPVTARAMGDAGAQLVARRFDPDAVAGLTLRAYEDAADRFGATYRSPRPAGVGR